MGTTVLSVKAHYELQTEAERAQAQGLIVDYYSAHDMVWEGVTTLAVDCRMIEDTTNPKNHAKSDESRLDMRACDSDSTGQDGLALDNTNEANHPKMARQRYDRQGAWLSGKCIKYRRWTYGHNVFPCRYCAAHLLVSRLVASTWRRRSFSEPPVCDTILASLSVPCADPFFTRWGRTFGYSTEGLGLP